MGWRKVHHKRHSTGSRVAKDEEDNNLAVQQNLVPFHLYIYLISCPGFFSFIVPRTFWFEAAAIRSIFEACLTLSRWSNKFPAEGDYAFCGPSPYQRALLSPHSLQFFFSYTQKHLIFYLRCIQERRSGISIFFLQHFYHKFQMIGLVI